MTAVQPARPRVGPLASVPRARLEEILDRTAERIVEGGTGSVAVTLSAIADATRHVRPGAAAALADPAAPEPARQRAFGILHGVVLGDLDDDELARLLDRLTGVRATAVRWTEVRGDAA